MLNLPSRHDLKGGEAEANYIRKQLTSVMVGHPGAVQYYTFYEVLDAWLGPWGEKGYPIGYGKFYAIAFNDNTRLAADPITSKWVKETTVFLQQYLVDYIVERATKKTLKTVTEPELRQAAFSSHAKAYTEGGLHRVVFIDPSMLPFIMLIPGREFIPWSADFAPTVLQVFQTIGLVALKTPGVLQRAPGAVFAAMLPAHSGRFREAIREDELALLREERVARHLDKLKEIIEDGEIDDLMTLQSTVDALNAKRWETRYLAQLARLVIASAARRQELIRKRYNGMLSTSPEMKKAFEEKFARLMRASAADGPRTVQQ